MSSDKFVYVTYIRTTPEKLWRAMIEPEFTRQIWSETWQECDWKVGSSYRFANQGKPTVEGEVLVSEPPRRLAYSWNNRKDAARGEGTSRVGVRLSR